MTLSTPLSRITSIGARIAPALGKLSLHTAGDLLLYWPYRYEDRSEILSIRELKLGEKSTIQGTVKDIKDIKTRGNGRRLITKALIEDGTGTLQAIWFNQRFLTRTLKPGYEVFLSGKVDDSSYGPQMTQPVYERATKSGDQATHTARIVPIYSLTSSVTQKQLRYLLKKVLPLANSIQEWLPEDIIKQYDLMGINDAISRVHFPESHTELEKATRRLKFDELFLINLRSARVKSALQDSRANKIQFKEKETKDFVDGLSFKLTDAQRKTAWEILTDLEKNKPMNRLLEGDVGSGKTIVCAIGILNALLNDKQVAYMAPTEILATQQFETFNELFKNQSFSISLLTGNQALIKRPDTQPEKLSSNKLLDLISDKDVDLVVGTHSLIQDRISYQDLALVVIDEQHRFGVGQRSALSKKSSDSTMAHFLSMTATPIPRSLALTLYGDLELSVIDQMPPGRKPIKTMLAPPEKRGEKYAFVHEQLTQGRQAFIICPLIDPSDTLGKKAVTEEYEKLKRDIFPDMRIGILHGKMKSADKEKVMNEFAKHNLDILVATPVIEVGIDVPNSTVIIIESAERFGLAQLHQFRGRVGRGKHQSYCILFTDSTSKETLNRLKALVETNDGFELAERDLEFRGPGEVYGIKQHGFDDVLKIAKLTDYPIIKDVRKIIPHIFAQSPDLSKFPRILKRLSQFEKSIHPE